MFELESATKKKSATCGEFTNKMGRLSYYGSLLRFGEPFSSREIVQMDCNTPAKCPILLANFIHYSHVRIDVW